MVDVVHLIFSLLSFRTTGDLSSVAWSIVAVLRFAEDGYNSHHRGCSIAKAKKIHCCSVLANPKYYRC